MASEVLLDASALMTLMFQEAGSERVVHRLARAAISSVNLAEVASKLNDTGFAMGEMRERLEGFGLEVIHFTQEDAFAAGALRSQTRERGLSLGDRACLAVAQRLTLPALTADRAWAGLDVGVEVVLIR